MTTIMIFTELNQTQLFSNFLQNLFFRLVTTKFWTSTGRGVTSRVNGLREPWVFKIGTKCGISQAHAAIIGMVIDLGQQAQALGIAFKLAYIGFLFRTQIF